MKGKANYSKEDKTTKQPPSCGFLPFNLINLLSMSLSEFWNQNINYFAFTKQGLGLI